MKTFIFLIIFSILSLNTIAQFTFAKEKVIYGSKKKGGKIGILYTLNDGTFLFQYGELGEKGFVHGKGISAFFKDEPSSTTLSAATKGFDSWNYTDEYYEGDLQNGIKFGKGRLKDDKRFYEGDFENNFPHGFGEIKKHDGSSKHKFVYKYKGFFYKGFPHGPGELMEHGNLGVSVAHYPNEYYTGMIIKGKPKGLSLYEKEGGNEKFDRKKSREFVYRSVNFNEIKSYSDLINNDTTGFIKLFDYNNVLNLNEDTVYNGNLNENKRLTGLGYMISSNGTVLCGNFDNGKLNGYGFYFSVTEKTEIKIKTEYSIFDYEFMNGLFVEGKLVKGTKDYMKVEIRKTGSSFFNYGGSVSEILDLELTVNELENLYYSGTFNEEGNLDGPSCYYDSRSITKSGTFKNGKLHGKGYLKNSTGKFDGRFEEDVFKEGKITYSATGPMGPPHEAILVIDGVPGIFNKYTGLTYDGRRCDTWDYYSGDSQSFFNYCKDCKGAGRIWKKCTSTYQVYTHLENRSRMVTYGSNTYIQSWSEPQYKSVSVTTDCSFPCETCWGKGRSPKTLEEIKEMINKK